MKQIIGIYLLCFIVFVTLFIILFSCILYFFKKFAKDIKNGEMDAEITKDYNDYLLKSKNSKHKKIKVILNLFSWIIIAFVVIFLLYFIVNKNKPVGKVPVLKTVETPSMSFKDDGNSYLFENNLDDQIKTNDLIILNHLPKEEEIQVFDIIAYRNDKGYIILHRVINIEIDENGERLFEFRGDANNASDSKLVEYNQMLGIYKDNKIPYLGTFVRFLKSPAGILCLVLMIFVMIIYPYINDKILKIKKDRLIEIGLINENEKIE